MKPDHNISRSSCDVKEMLRRHILFKTLSPSLRHNRSLVVFRIQSARLKLKVQRTPREATPFVKLIRFSQHSPIGRVAKHFTKPHTYQEHYSGWREVNPKHAYDDGGRSLRYGSLIKVVSWNLDFASRSPSTRAAAAIIDLQHVIWGHPDSWVILLQEVCENSAQQLLK